MLQCQCDVTALNFTCGDAKPKCSAWSCLTALLCVPGKEGGYGRFLLVSLGWISWDFSVFDQFPLLCGQADADSFYMACNGRQFNSIEEDVCQLVYVERAEVFKSEDVSLFCFVFFFPALQKVLTGLFGK